MIDADHFKRFNDAHGHEAGDAALKVIAHTMRDLFRESDIVCRFGGEEFCVVLPACSLENDAARGDQLRKRIADAPIIVRGQRLTVTLSIGASTREHGEDGASMIKHADGALYEAKRHGRDRVERYGKAPAAANTSNAA